MSHQKSILHIDMDAFFASLESERKGIDGPIVICVYSGRSEDSGAVSTCSYDARELGIHAAMPITRAKDIVENSDDEVHFLPMDRKYYRQVSDRIREEVFDDYSERIEQASIDEAYLELEGSIEESVDIAEEIQREVNQKFGITCSVGVAPNKLVAKIASDREKPEGLTVVKEDEVEEFMSSLELEDIHGIGGKTVERLEELGIESVEELTNADKSVLVREFGENLGIKLKQMSQGIDSSEVREQDQKQITRMTTLAENSDRSSYIRKYFPELAEEIIEKAEEKDVGFRKVSLIIIDTDIEMYTRTTTLKSHVQDMSIIIEKGEGLLEEFLDNFEGQVRRIGLRIKDLKEIGDQKRLKEF